MFDHQKKPASIADQIYALMLANLADQEEFDDVTVSRLQVLVDKNRLSHPIAILGAIQAQPEDGS